jgi:two-component system response regulator VicR
MTKTIMVVDDEQRYHDLYGMMLRDTDYGIISAYDGGEALAKVEEKKPDLMIIDIVLDMMPGDTLLFYLKSMHGYDNIPIIVASNLSSHTYKYLKEFDPDLVFLDKTFTTKERLVNEIKAKIG